MQNASSGEIGQVVFDQFAFNVVSSHDHTHVALYRLIKSRKRETALIADLLAFNSDDLGVNEYERIRLSFLCYIHHEEPLRQANLRRRKADAAGIAHRLEHIRDGPFEFGTKRVVADRFTYRQQNRLGIMNYPHQGHKQIFYRNNTVNR